MHSFGEMSRMNGCVKCQLWKRVTITTTWSTLSMNIIITTTTNTWGILQLHQGHQHVYWYYPQRQVHCLVMVLFCYTLKMKSCVRKASQCKIWLQGSSSTTALQQKHGGGIFSRAFTITSFSKANEDNHLENNDEEAKEKSLLCLRNSVSNNKMRQSLPSTMQKEAQVRRAVRYVLGDNKLQKEANDGKLHKEGAPSANDDKRAQARRRRQRRRWHWYQTTRRGWKKWITEQKGCWPQGGRCHKGKSKNTT